MTAINLQERIATLEREVHEIKTVLKIVSETQQPWWERLAGTFKENSLFDEIVEAGQAYRRSLASRVR